MKCSGENVILREIVHVVSYFHLHFMLYRGYLDCISNRVSRKVDYLWDSAPVNKQKLAPIGGHNEIFSQSHSAMTVGGGRGREAGCSCL